jgi:abhydrolase domain-containing protein 6
MIHGFGGGGPVFCRMVAKMRTHFTVTMIDLLGLGGSGRPDFLSQEYEYAKNWFLDSIHEWTEKTGFAGEPFHLIGHSFGGTIAGMYAFEFP